MCFFLNIKCHRGASAHSQISIYIYLNGNQDWHNALNTCLASNFSKINFVQRKLTANYHLSLYCHPNLFLLFILPLYYHAGSRAGWYTQDLRWMQPPTDKKELCQLHHYRYGMWCQYTQPVFYLAWQPCVFNACVCVLECMCVCLWKDKPVYNTCKIGQLCEKFWGFL